jgi:hypothetical protein
MVGALGREADGKLRQQRFGTMSVRSAMGIGVVLGVLAALLAGGAFATAYEVETDGGLGLPPEDLERFLGEIDAGHVLVGVMALETEVQSVMDVLARLSGRPEAHRIQQAATT